MAAKQQSLKRVAGLNGMTVAELARAVGRSRMTVYRAWRTPESYRPTWRKMTRLLPVGGRRG